MENASIPPIGRWSFNTIPGFSPDKDGFRVIETDRHPDGYGVELTTDKKRVFFMSRPSGVSDPCKDAIALRDQSRPQILVGRAPVGIFRSDAAGNVIDVNETWCGMSGLSAIESVNDNLQRVIHPGDRLRVRSSWLCNANRRNTSVCEFRLLHRDGTFKWVLGRIQGDLDDVGNIGGYVGAVTDITDLKLAEESVRCSLDEVRRSNCELSTYKTGVDQIAIFTVLDCTGRFVYVNEKLCEISGYRPSDLLGRNHNILDSHYHLKVFFLNLYRTVGRGRLWRGEIRSQAKDGHFYWVETSIIPIRDESGDVARFVMIGTEITRRKCEQNALETHRIARDEANSALTGRNNKLLDLNKTAERFVDDVSHEFRTPLSVIKGYSEIMRAGIAGPLTLEQMRFTQLIIDRAHDMAQMVDDLLDSSKMRAGVLRVDRRPNKVSDIFAALHPIIDGRIAANGIQWVEDIEIGLPSVFADSEKVKRVLVNLTVNAIKFSPAGSRITLSARSNGEGEVAISVADCGPGISQEHLAVIFNRFRQVGNADLNTKGFGLGLNIAQELVALNLGQVSVESELGKGSIFSFTLPADDPKIIITRLLNRLRNIGAPRGQFAFLRIEAQPAIGAQFRIAELRGFLSSTTYPNDIIMPTDDDSCLIAFGHSTNPQEWQRRLIQSGLNRDQSSPLQRICAFNVELTDVLPYPASLSDLISILLRQLGAQPVGV